jgi:hypothetical protein
LSERFDPQLQQQEAILMEVHIQRCEKCQSTAVTNLLVRESGQPQTVYVKCVSCGEFVARYRLSEYYHHGEGIESWLRSQGSAAPESGRDFLGEFERVKTAANEGFAAANARLEEQQQADEQASPSESVER